MQSLYKVILSIGLCMCSFCVMSQPKLNGKATIQEKIKIIDAFILEKRMSGDFRAALPGLYMGIQLAEKYKIDTLLVQYSYFLGYCYQFTTQYDSSLYFLHKSEALAYQQKYYKYVARSQLELCNIYELVSQNDSIQSVMARLSEVMPNLDKNSWESASYWTRKGHDTFFLAQYDESLAAHQKALQIFQFNKDTINTAVSFFNIGRVHKMLRNLPLGLFYLRQANQLYTQLNYIHLTGQCDYEIGVIFKETNQLDSAKIYFEKSYKMAQQYENKHLQCIAMMGMGEIVKNEPEGYEKAKKIFLEAGRIARVDELWHQVKGAYMAIGELEFERANFINAKINFEQALKIASQVKSNEDILICYQSLASTENTLKNFSQAYQYKSLAFQYQDSIYSEKTTRAVAEMETKYQTEKKQQQITLLEKENENKNLLLENEKRNRFLLFGFLLSSFLVAGLLYRSYRIKQKSNLALGEKNEELSSLNEELNVINERLDEANRTKSQLFSIIGHDLRSPVSQLVTYLNLQKESPEILDTKTKQGFEQDLRQSSENLLFTLEDILSWSKSQLEHFSLFSEEVKADTFFKELLDFHRRTAAEKQVRLLSDFSPDLTFQTDPNFLKVILRNLLANAVKFTLPGGSVSLSATREGSMLRIAVSDTGKGMIESDLATLFDDKITSSATGWGLKLTREFTQKLGGKLSVRSQPGEGTTFELEIPA
jgi:signal transduction histidine kinase